MFDSFTTQLKTFAMSVDSVDEDMMKRVGEAVYNYMKECLGTCYHEIAIHDPSFRAESEDDQVLQIKFCRYRRRIGGLARLTSDSGEIRSQKAYAFLKGKQVWLNVDSAEDFLRSAQSGEALSVVPDTIEDLPDYRCYEDDGDGIAKTAILFPLRYMERKIGVATIEFGTQMDFSRDVRDQLAVICDSVAKICGRFIDTNNNKNDTHRAFEEIMRSVDFKDCGLRSKPVVFLSYSHDADKDVVGAIKTVVYDDEVRDRITIYDWSAETEPGPISSQIVDQIRASRIGVCYLSEKAGDGRYQDNPNVLFEAGMFHVLRGNSGSHLEGWLPIRENPEISSPLPFNFAGDRVLVVPRTGDRLNEPLFLERLQQHFDRLLGISR